MHVMPSPPWPFTSPMHARQAFLPLAWPDPASPCPTYPPSHLPFGHPHLTQPHASDTHQGITWEGTSRTAHFKNERSKGLQGSPRPWMRGSFFSLKQGFPQLHGRGDTKEGQKTLSRGFLGPQKGRSLSLYGGWDDY